jgi:hypothetical protein
MLVNGIAAAGAARRPLILLPRRTMEAELDESGYADPRNVHTCGRPDEVDDRLAEQRTSSQNSCSSSNQIQLLDLGIAGRFKRD